MTSLSPHDRRRFLQAGGLAALGGLVLAACGEDDTAGTVTVPPRLGVAPDRPTLPDAVVNDVVLLRTATSLEHLAIDTYTLVLDELSDLFTGEAAALVPVIERFRDDHERHAEVGEALTEELGGEPYRCANPRFVDLYLEPAVELIVGTEAARSLGFEGSTVDVPATDTPLDDVLMLAYGLESLARASYQALVPVLSEPSLRRDAMVVAAEESRHATVLARQIAPDLLLLGEDDLVATLPTAFGQLGQIPIAIGAPNEVGNKTQVTLETPSLNALVYEYVESC